MAIAVVASLFLHLLFALFFPALRPVFTALRPVPRPTPREIVTIEHLTFERRKPAPHRHKAPAAAPPLPRVAQQPATAPRPLLPRAPVQPHATHVALAKPAPAPVRVVPAALGHPKLSDRTIAHIEEDLGASIRADRTGEDPLNNVPTDAPPPEPKHYTADYSSLELGGHGLCDDIKSWSDGTWDWYFVACNMHLDDGTVERQPVPWPIRFSPNDDPFAGTMRGVGEVPLPLPLPGWHLPAGETVSDQLRQYASAHGVEI